MGLNKSTGNMYDFIDFTWNTIKGECPHGCTYCYMKRWYNEDRPQPPVRFDEKELKTDLGSGNFIFVGSSCDMWAEDIPLKWIVATLKHCSQHDGNKYLFQSKNPIRMNGNVRLMKARFAVECVVCTTIETNRHYPEIMMNSPLPYDRAKWMQRSGLDNYVTIEPIMAFDLPEMVELIRMCNPVQVNIGADSGNNGLPEPSWSKVMELKDALSEFTTISAKRNLSRLERE